MLAQREEQSVLSVVASSPRLGGSCDKLVQSQIRRVCIVSLVIGPSIHGSPMRILWLNRGMGFVQAQANVRENWYTPRTSLTSPPHRV